MQGWSGGREAGAWPRTFTGIFCGKEWNKRVSPQVRLGLDGLSNSGGSGPSQWPVVVQNLALGWFRGGGILAWCASVIKEMVGAWARGWWFVYQSWTYGGVICSPYESANPGGGSFSRIKASNVRVSKIQKIRKYGQYSG